MVDLGNSLFKIAQGWWGHLCIVWQPLLIICSLLHVDAVQHSLKKKAETKSVCNQDKHQSQKHKQEVQLCRTPVSTCREEDCLVCVTHFLDHCSFQGVTTVIALD